MRWVREDHGFGSWEAESEKDSRLASRQVIYLFSQPMWTVSETMKSARVGGRAGHREDEVGSLGSGTGLAGRESRGRAVWLAVRSLTCSSD